MDGEDSSAPCPGRPPSDGLRPDSAIGRNSHGHELDAGRPALPGRPGGEIEVTVATARAAADQCTYTISGLPMSEILLMRFTAGTGGNMLDGAKRRLAAGEIEGETVSDLGEEAMLNMTNQVLLVRLEDGTFLNLALSIYGLGRQPLDADAKRQGLLELGRLAAERTAE